MVEEQAHHPFQGDQLAEQNNYTTSLAMPPTPPVPTQPAMPGQVANPGYYKQGQQSYQDPFVHFGVQQSEQAQVQQPPPTVPPIQTPYTGEQFSFNQNGYGNFAPHKAEKNFGLPAQLINRPALGWIIAFVCIILLMLCSCGFVGSLLLGSIQHNSSGQFLAPAEVSASMWTMPAQTSELQVAASLR